MPSNKDKFMVTNKQIRSIVLIAAQLGWDLKMEVPLRENLRENSNPSSDYF